jgi:hypothetical protein
LRLSFRVFEKLAEPIEAPVHHLAVSVDPLPGVLQASRAENALSSAPDLLGPDELDVLEHAHVLLHSGQRDPERLRQLGDRGAAVAEPLEDGPARRVGERREGSIESRLILNHVVQYSTGGAP